VIPAAVALFLLGAFQSPASDAIATAQKLYSDQRWADVVALWRTVADAPADFDYYAGMSLARLNRLNEAKDALEAGRKKNPRDKRFPMELAGLAFRRKDLSSTKSYLGHALRLAPEDRYAIDFLGSVYFLERNLEAALIYWNRIDKPRVEQIRMEPQPRVDAQLLDRAFAVAPASTLVLRDLRVTRASLELLGIFPRYRLTLEPLAETEKYDLLFQPDEHRGLLSMFRGAPYLTIYPEFYNLGHAGVNVTSLFRFDPEKYRAFAAFSTPVAGNPGRQLRFSLDGRQENWDLTDTYRTAPLADLSLRKIEARAEIRSLVNDWTWSSGVSLSDRRLARAPGGDLPFSNGTALEYRAGLDRQLLRLPQKRLAVNTSASAAFGKLFARGLDPFARIAGSVDMRWFPQAEGDRYVFSTTVRSGKAFGDTPFDELFMLGLERDNDLPLRAHIGTRDGRKGAAPLGRTYFLLNLDADRTIYEGGFLKIKLGPFLDSGRITDPAGAFGSPRWLWDVGAQLKVRILSTVTVTVSYGKDLRSGRNAFYAASLGPSAAQIH